MNNVGSSFLLLAVALLLLWLAVTNKLSNLLDAWDVATGKATAKQGTTNTSGPVAAAGVVGGQTNVTLSLPSLPAISTMANVGIS